MAAICASWYLYVAHARSALSSCCLYCFKLGEPHATGNLSSSHSVNIVGHTALGAQQMVTQSLQLPYTVGKGILLKVLFLPVTQSTLNLLAIKSGDSGVVIGYQADEFTHMWLAEHIAV